MPPKEKRKRKRKEEPVTSFNVAGISNGLESSLDECLAELEGSIASPSKSQRSLDKHEAVRRHALESKKPFSADENYKLWDPSLESSSLRPAAPKEALDRIRAWNTDFNNWAAGGAYTAGLLPSFDVELARHFQIQNLSRFLLESCPGVRLPTFERWILDSKLEERNGQRTKLNENDDVILSRATPNFLSSQRLVEELVFAGKKLPDALSIVRDLCRKTQSAKHEIRQEWRRCQNQTPLKGSGERIDQEDHGVTISLVYHRKKWKKPFCVKLNKAHYNKLREMFLRVHNSNSDHQGIQMERMGKPTKAMHVFHFLVMVLQLRYSSLAGGQLLNQLRGGGMQGAVHGDLFRVLREVFPNEPFLECFASPFNAYLPSFGSAFPDIDWHFGSMGDFLAVTIDSGLAEANPPFSPGVMESMVDRMEQNLNVADSEKKALTFVVIVPSVSGDLKAEKPAKRFAHASFRKMVCGPLCRHHIILRAKEHGYIYGAQHMRKTRYRDSSYDTSVILLQSLEARRQNISVHDFEERVRKVLHSRFAQESEKDDEDSHG